MKYIRFKIAGFVVFEDHNIHADMARKFPRDEVISAGSVAIYCEEHQVGAFGDSVSLGKSSREDDGARIYNRLSV
jgi:hypothetical protein